MDNESEITSAVEIVHILRQLIKHRELLNASFNQGKDSITTLLLDVDPKGALIFDGSSNAAVNLKIVAAAKVIFTGNLLGAKVRFSSAGVREIKYQGKPALSIKLPGALSRAQNRETFRVKASSAACMLPVPGRGSVKVTVDEISIGGVQLMLNHSADVFMLNQTISGCRIELGSFGSITCNLEVRSLKRTPSRMLGMGCRFVGLSKANEALLARFVAQQEHKSVTSRGGLFGL